MNDHEKKNYLKFFFQIKKLKVVLKIFFYCLFLALLRLIATHSLSLVVSGCCSGAVVCGLLIVVVSLVAALRLSINGVWP